MAKTKVYSRYPNPIEFTFSRYTKGTEGMEVEPISDIDRIILNGTTEIVNHTLVTKEGAVTIFGDNEHSVAKRLYTAADFERLKEHPLFKKMLKDGNLSLDTIEDLSRDFGVGRITAAELKEGLAKQKNPDGDAVTVA